MEPHGRAAGGTPHRPSASIVLATHSRPEFLAECVTGIAAAMRAGDELIVMECCNPEATAVLGRLSAPITHVSGRHAAKSPKLNAAISAALGDVILVTDDDCRVPPDWVDTMTHPFANPAVGVAFGPVAGLSEVPASRSRPVVPAGPAPAELWNYAHGASMAVRRSAVVDAGGFDERLGAGAAARGGEEADLVLRLRARGWTCEIADVPVVHHLDWRDSEQTTHNLMGYQRGTGAYLGAGLRRRPGATVKPLALRVLHERGLWRDRALRGPWFGPRMSFALAGGLARGLTLRPRRFLDEPAIGGASAHHPRVLWVTDEPPDRSHGGGSIRQAMLLEHLHSRIDTTLLVVGELDDHVTRCSVSEVLELPRPREREPRSVHARRVLDLWQALAARRPSEVRRAARVRRVLAPVLNRIADDYDTVIVHHLHLAPLLPRRRRVPWILHLFDGASERTRQELAAERGRRQRWRLKRELPKARRCERAALRSYDRVVVVSESDAAALTRDDHDRADAIVVVPNGVEAAALLPTPLPAEPNVLLPATFSYRPNVLGAAWFCDQVLPLVQARVPGLRFHLVGRNPAPEVVALARRPGVELHADVPRIEPWLSWARAVVVPLHVGTGTRVKALEAMAAGRPVVGTSVGLEGLDLVDGVHARIVDDPVEMADAVVEVLTSDAQARRLATAARRHVEAQFQWSDCAKRLREALEPSGRVLPVRRERVACLPQPAYEQPREGSRAR